jgi:arsenical pump membrane protein
MPSRVHARIGVYVSRQAIAPMHLAFVLTVTAGTLAVFSGEAARLLILTVGTVLLMVVDSRLSVERHIERWGVPVREIWPPMLALLVAVRLELVDLSRAWEVVVDTSPIIVFILAFAIAAKGLGDSGFFTFAASRITSKGHGRTNRLILYLFALTSVLTYVTSNDIVILAVTPIIIATAVQSGISNARLLLLAQFIAANTISMGLFIGSPTNIILSESLGVNFFEYAALMFVPTTVAFMATFVMVHTINGSVLAFGRWQGRLGDFAGRWSFKEHYEPRAVSSEAWFGRDMSRWVACFVGGVLLTAGTTLVGASLYVAALPIIAVSLALGYVMATGRGRLARVRSAGTLLLGMPVGIIFFGFTFFVVADAFSATGFFAGQVVPSLEGRAADAGSWLPVWATGISGLSVNVFNDLPATALWAEAMVDMDFASPLERFAMIQSVLVGVNLGTYLTPVGALAGLIWFAAIRDASRRYAADGVAPLTPRRLGLIFYGLIVFVVVAFITSLSVLVCLFVIDWLLSPPGEAGTLELSGTGLGPVTFAATVLGLVVWRFRVALRDSGVALSHMKEAFAVVARLRILAVRYAYVYKLVVTVTFISSMAAVVFWAETMHAQVHDESRLFDDLGSFTVWFLVFVGSGFEQGLFPRSLLGMVFAGLLPLVILGAVVYLVRVPGTDLGARLSYRLATGSIPATRIAVVNYASYHDSYLRTLARDSQAFLVLFPARGSTDQAAALQAAFGEHRVHIAAPDGDPAGWINEYRLDTVTLLLLGPCESDQGYDPRGVLVELERLLRHVESEVVGCGQAETDNEVAQRPDVPGVILECPDGATLARIERSDIRLVEQSLIVLEPEEELARYLAADALCDVALLSEHYRLAGSSPTNGDGGHYAALAALGALRRFSAPAAVLGDGTPRQDAQTLGVITEVGGIHSTFSRADFDRARRTGDVEGLLGLGPADVDDGAENPGHPPQIVLVHLNSRARSFVRRLRGCGYRGEVLLLTDETPPADGPSGTTSIAIDCPRNAVAQLLGTQGDGLLVPGSRVYVFLDERREVASEHWTMRFLEAMDERWETAEVSADHIHLVVETRHSGSMHLYRQLYVDKVIDPDHMHRSYFQNLGEIHHRLCGSGLTRRESRWALRQLPHTHELAQFLMPFWVVPATAERWETRSGEMLELAAMEFRSAQRLVREQTGHSLQLVARLRLDETRGRPRIRVSDTSHRSTIDEEDLLICIPYV